LATTLGGLFSALLVALPLSAQTGSIVGTVIDKTGLQPLNGVQVSVDGTTRGTLTDARGRFSIAGIPVGSHTVRATYIGYRTETKPATVAVGAAATVNFEMGVSAVSLDEVVVTGTAGAVEKKQLGATVSTVSVANVQEKVPVTDVGSVLQSRIPGLRSVGTAGGVGASRDLRIRGTSSFQLNQRPVVYIDGVKVDTRQAEWGAMGGSCCSYSGGAGTDRLNDLNPNDIERIEVIKGAAAGTLYGTEAANGVIQIFTKKGRSDSAPRWSAQITTGGQRFRENLATTTYPRFTGPDGTVAFDANKTLIETGPYLGADVTVQGGGTSATYFISGGYSNEQGSIQPNYMKRGNLRMNMHWVAAEKLSFDVTSAYVRNFLEELQSGNNWTSLMGNAVLGVPYTACSTGCLDGVERPYGEPWVPIAAIKKIDTSDDVARWTGGVTMNWNPISNFTHKLQFGLDGVNEERQYLRPFGYPYTYVPQGEKQLAYRNFRAVTADYLGSLNFENVAPGLNTRISFGAQAFKTEERFNSAVGNTYAAPGVTTVRGGSIKSGDETFTEQTQVGVFAQNRFGFRDKFFLTTGIRIDGNSAFGENFGMQAYPNVQASYDASSLAFLPEFVSNLRFRGALGTAGQAPGAFDKFLTFTPFTTGDEQSGVRASTGGNQELGPERTTEKELGFELGLWNDRIGIDATVYRRDTKDLIASVGQAPSVAFGNAPRVNIGSLLDQGYEMSLRIVPLEASKVRWSSDIRIDGNHNEITDLGMDADTAVLKRACNGTYVCRVGMPVRTNFGRVLCTEKYSSKGATDPASGGCSGKTAYNPVTRLFTRSDTTVFLGKTLPDFNVSFGNEITFGAFRLYANVTYERGAWFGNSDRPYRANNRTGDEYLSLLNDATANPAGCVTSWPTAPTTGPRYVDAARHWCDTVASDSLYQLWRTVSPVDSRENIRIREISIGWQVPESFSNKLGFSRTSITLAGQNLQWWDKCNCMDPNMTYQGGADFGETSGFLGQPQARMVKLSIRTTF
jgi:TonB-dependent SusC/RagA subfamily outer membrane receptor